MDDYSVVDDDSKKSVLFAKCAHTLSKHVRNVALKRVVCVSTTLSICSQPLQVSFGENFFFVADDFFCG